MARREVNELLEGSDWSACFRGEGYEYSRVGWSTCKGRGERFRELDAVRHADDGGGSGERSLRNWKERGRLIYRRKKNGLRNLFGFICRFITARTRRSR